MMRPLQLSLLPTPLHRLERLSNLFGVELWCKRDDLTAFGFGGNKTRKLDFLIAEAVRKNASDLVAVGGVQSNFCRIASAYAARVGMRAHLVLGASEARFTAGGNLALDELFGASITRVYSDDWADWEAEAEAVRERISQSGSVPYLMPVGGSTPVGALGYVNAMRELSADAPLHGIEISTILHATSSGGTQAGLLTGKALEKWPGRVIGIAVAKSAAQLADEITGLAKATAESAGAVLDSGQVIVDDRFIGEAYAVPTEAGREAQQLFARMEGILLDDVYTAKAAAGLIAMCRSGEFEEDKAVVFLNTGGSPQYFADASSSRARSD